MWQLLVRRRLLLERHLVVAVAGNDSSVSCAELSMPLLWRKDAHRRVQGVEAVVCPGCSAELQFSDAYGWVVQLCFFGVVLLALYLLGFRGWKLFGATVLAGSLLTVVLIGPLGRILPPGLEPYCPPPPLPQLPTLPWKDEKYTTLFPREFVDSEKSTQAGQGGHETPKDS